MDGKKCVIIFPIVGVVIMNNDESRRNAPLFPMSSAMKLTGLTARQVRHYEAAGLIRPARSEGNHRLFSMNDFEKLLTIKMMMEKGFTMKRIGEILGKDESHPAGEILNYKELNRTLPNRGDLSRFF